MATPTQTRYATLTVDDEEYRLEPGDSLSIGRHRENDVVIHSASVSRFHASVRWLDGRSPEIVDHGSQNGTVMGGLEIRRRPAPLRDGVVILIGSRVMQVRLRNPGDAALLEDAPEIVALYTDQRPELTGSVDSADELARLLRTLETEERTGTLHVLPTDVEGGRITVCMGLINFIRRRSRPTRSCAVLRPIGGPIMTP